MARKSKTDRLPRLVRPPAGREPGILAIAGRKGPEFYAFREIPCAIGGRGFKVQRLGRPDLYHVRIGRPDQCSCECLGFLRHGKCKHIAALLST
ncbi:MAG: SWIM zinc finger family protein [Planctomycetes bacterium]|nr:SWIM zinc finger family protein [Planctomycetota bacterium]